MRSLRFIANQLRMTEFPVSCFNQFSAQREHGGGRGRIRTSVARKERQIYSLLVLATHPPVLEKSPAKHQPHMFDKLRCERKHKTDSCQETPARLFLFPGFAPPHSPANFLVELAEGIEPPT